eukprot:jgi/Astpho2/6883/Aster-07883
MGEQSRLQARLAALVEAELSRNATINETLIQIKQQMGGRRTLTLAQRHSSTMAAKFLLRLCGAAALIAVTSAQSQTVTIQGGDCTGITFGNLGDKFSYTASVALSGSNTSSCISVTKLYIQDACLDSRDNDLGLDAINPKNIRCDDATDASAATCNSAFSLASASSIVSGQRLSGQIDSGNVCANEATGFFYVKSNCTQSEDVTVTFTPTDYNGAFASCVDIAGHHISGLGIALIVVAVLIVLVLLSLIICCCCCSCCR